MLQAARAIVVAGILIGFPGIAPAQYAGAPGSGKVFNPNYHISFERPEAWGLKYYASVSLLSGLPVPTDSEGAHLGSISVGLEADWLPELDAGQQRIGFNGKTPEDLNKTPIFLRPVVRIGLPDKFTVLVAAPPPARLFGVQPRLLAFGLERPLFARNGVTLGWRGYGQFGEVKGSFTCPSGVLGSAPGSPGNPTDCVARSEDKALLRYAGSEFDLSYRIPHSKFIPHAAAGGNFMDLVFETHAPVSAGLDETRMWTHGGTFTTTGGITYLVSKRAAFTVDAFYTPLWVRRSPTSPRVNDGLFNVRALMSYTFR
jgi:hypothetical protein